MRSCAVADERADVDADRAVVAGEVVGDGAPVVVDVRTAIEPGVELRRTRRGPRAARNGAKPLPSTPTISVVTPWRTLGSWRGSARITRPPWLCRSMKPGATTRPVASIRRADVLGERRVRGRGAGAGRPRRRPCPARRGAPVPSTIVPPVISRSTLSVMPRPRRARRPGPPGGGRGPRRRGPCRDATRKIRRLARSAGVVVRRLPGERRRVGGIDGDQVGLLAGLERADDVAQAQRLGAAERARAAASRAAPRTGAVLDARHPPGVLRVEPDPHRRVKIDRSGPPGDVRAEPEDSPASR